MKTGDARQFLHRVPDRDPHPADEVEPPAFRELLYYLVDTVLEKATAPEEEPSSVAVQLGLLIKS